MMTVKPSGDGAAVAVPAIGPGTGLLVIDARSGERMWPGKRVEFYETSPDGTRAVDKDDSFTLLGIRDNIFSAEANIRYDNGRESGWVRIPVRLFHPNFFLQRVAFILS